MNCGNLGGDANERPKPKTADSGERRQGRPSVVASRPCNGGGAKGRRHWRAWATPDRRMPMTSNRTTSQDLLGSLLHVKANREPQGSTRRRSSGSRRSSPRTLQLEIDEFRTISPRKGSPIPRSPGRACVGTRRIRQDRADGVKMWPSHADPIFHRNSYAIGREIGLDDASRPSGPNWCGSTRGLFDNPITPPDDGSAQPRTLILSTSTGWSRRCKAGWALRRATRARRKEASSRPEPKQSARSVMPFDRSQFS